MRKTFFDLLNEIKFDVYQEYKTLLYLFAGEVKYYNGHRQTFKEYVNDNFFRKFSFRAGFIDIDDMMTALGINRPSSNVGILFVFCEFLYTILCSCNGYNEKTYTQCKTISENIENILAKTNHRFIEDPNNKGKQIIVEKNKAATLAAEIVSDKILSFEILEYNHYALKGDLVKKKQILVSIGAFMEPILNTKVLSNAGYKKLESNAGFLLNNFHVRHNNKEGTKAQEYIVSINDSDLEKWYDKIYDVLIQAIITNENIKIENEIDSIKQNYAWGK